MLNQILYLIFITFLPIFELRVSIPYGINVLRMAWPSVFIICVIANIIIGIIIYLLLDKFVHFFLRYKIFSTPYNKIVLKIQKNIQKSVDKYGELGVAIFIGVPLPGSGVYSAALGAYVIGLNFKKFIIADIIGVLIAGTIVTIISTGVLQLIIAFVLLVGFLVDNMVLKIMPLIENPVLNYLSSLFTNLGQVLIITIVLISLFLFNKKKREWVFPLGLSLVFSYIITNILKFIIARPRPLGIIKTLPLINLIDYSFPSSHAAVAFAALPILNKIYPRLKWLWILSVCFVAFSRIYIQVHYLSDVIMGALVGYFVSLFVIKLKREKWKLTGLR